MSENNDSEANNLCLTEDAFDEFQAVSMYQEEEYITLPVVAPTKPKEPDPGDISHLSYDNEVVVSTENQVNSTVNDNTEEMQSEMEQKTFDDSSYLETKDIDQNYEPQKVTKKGRKKKHAIQNDTEVVSNNITVLGYKASNDIQVNTAQESSLISSTVPRKRGRKPKPKPIPPEPGSPSEINQDSLNISSSRLSSDPETSDIVASVKRRRGRPRKSFPNDVSDSKPLDKDLSGELSGSDSHRNDGVVSTRKRGRPKKMQQEISPQSEVKNNTEIPSNDLISLEDLNGTQASLEHSKELIELDISKIENRDLDKKIFSDSDDFDDVSLSKLKTHPETSKSADENTVSENNQEHQEYIANSSSEHANSNPQKRKKRNSSKKGGGKQKKVPTLIDENNQEEINEKSECVAVSSVSNNETQVESSHIDSDDNEELSLSQLKEMNNDLANAENNNTTVVSTTDNHTDDVKVETIESTCDIDKTPTKRNTKMPVMSDFEYNIDSVIEKDDTGNEANGDNDLLVEDTSKRPIRRKVAKLRYHEESDEDPFANVELSDDDEPRRKGKRYYSDDEYVPGRRGNNDIDSTDSEMSLKGVKGLVNESPQKRKKLRKKSENQSPQKKGKVNTPILDLENDDIEVCLQPSTVLKPTDDTDSSKLWGCSNEFENFLAKKIHGTNLKIKKVSATSPTENKALEIPVLDPEAKKTYEMCTQTSIIHTTAIGVQTSTPYDIPMKENIALTPEQSENACYFLNSIVKTTSELGTLMTQKSEDFIKKKINTSHVTDTMKMDYCVKKSFLLFKLAKHNLMQMEEDLAKQYDDFLKANNLTKCRELPQQIVASVKPVSSDSDCEIVEEPVKPIPAKKSKEKPKFNPKTVFLNKELSIKIAKKPCDISKKLDIKGRHTVWINDTVMVKKVNKPTQSFLAQDSRNKKPPDNTITTKMVSDFFKNYYRQKAISLCAPFTSTDWLNVNKECVCNYFVVQPIQFNNDNDVNYSTNGGISTENHASTSETNHTIKQIPNKAIITCPETLIKLCFRIVKNQIHDKRCVKEVFHQNIQNELTDGKNQPITLFRQCLEVLTGRAVKTMERSPTPSVCSTPEDISTVPPLKIICHRRMVELLSSSSSKDLRDEHEDAETRCSTAASNYSISSYSSKCSSPSIKMKAIKSLLSLCVEFIQRKQVIELSDTMNILTPKSLKTTAFECVKDLIFGDIHVPSLATNEFNLEQHNEGIMIEGLTINSINTLSEEAFLNLEQSHADNPDSPDYLDDFDNEDHYEQDFNEIEEENPIEAESSWVSQVQMEEPRSCYSTTHTDINEGVSIVAQIKIEPEEDLPDNLDSLAHVKIETIHGPDEMISIPEVKPEAIDVLGSAPPDFNRQNSNSYDVDAFEQFAASNKILHELQGDDVFSQSIHRIRRQHEPDYDEDDMSMSLLVPQTYEPLTIETAKGSLMESSSSDGESSKNKKTTGKKKPEPKRKGKQKKADPKTVSKETPIPTKDKDKPTNEVANLTKRMRDRIRQEEKQDDSTDSETENLPLRLRSRKEQEKSKQAQASTPIESEIQCNNVDSTDQVDEDVGNFTGFSAIDQNEITNYQKYMQFVYNKIIPDKDEETQSKKAAEIKSVHEEPLISNEPAELLECEPTMPIFDEPVGAKRSTRKGKAKAEILKKEEISKKAEISKEEEVSKNVDISKKEEISKKENISKKEEISKKENILKKEEISKKENISKKDEILKKEEVSKKGITVKKDVDLKEKVLEEAPSYIERHGWHCYPVNRLDGKLYQSSCVALEKLPESFVQTYFEYQGITSKNIEDQEIDRLTNLNSLNRTVQLNLSKNKLKSKREAKSDQTSEVGSRAESPTYSDHYAELEPSDDEGANVDDEVAPPVPLKQTENTLAKSLLMNDNDSDSDSAIQVKKEPSDGTEAKHKHGSKSKKKVEPVVEDGGDLMLTADKMMNKELTLLHAPVVVNDDVQDTPTKGPVTRNKQKSATKNQPSSSKVKNEEDSSSEEEKQWVSTKEKLLKRMGKKDQTSLDDAKRAKLVSEFIERRGYQPDSHMRARSTRPRRSGKKFLERQKQLGILSRELFGESSDMCMSKRSQASLFRGRRNIRKVIDKKSLARSTVIANMEEFERKKRLNNRQAQLRELLGCEEGVNVLVINDEVCLEYDFEENRPVVTVHPFFTKVMKAHQYEGVKFMWDACFESLAEIAAGRPGGGCILAHCMGLGKTLQVLALLHTVLTHPGVKMQRVLVCCPLSTVLNWVDEIHKWIGPVTNQIKVFELSKLKKTYERAYQLEDWYNGGGIFIIGYELFRSLTTLDPVLDDVRPTIVNKIRTALLDPGPDIVVCDEGHLLKNDCSVLAVAMSRVVTKRRIILTGTPMQNNLREYYCMVNFVKPNLLGTYAEYSNRFENPIMNGQHRDSLEEDIKLMKARTHILHKVLEGCLQRQEASVLYPYLPKKHEYTLFISLTPCQWDLYKHYLNNYGKQTKQSLLKDFHILQKIWSHPQVLHNFQTKARDRDEKNKLIKPEKLEDDLATEDLAEIKPNAAVDLWWLEYLDGGNMLETLDSSNKFVVVFRILDECIALGDKVLIFSTSLFCLDALEYFLKKIKQWSLGHEYYRLDGSVPAEVRQKWCREFNADNNNKTKLFLVSTRAGCLGLNMTAANRVIIMDTSWNPAHDIQSIFRVYRFGQKKDCYIYRLVAMGTMEQKIYERSVTKQAVACRVVDEQQIDRHYNMAELTELYKFDEGLCVAGGVAVGVHDVALLRVARDVLLHAVHEHDSLLRGSGEQGLPEHERNAAWMQFQQEQASKQMENKLIVNIPKVALKRIREHEKTSPSATAVKEEDTSEDYNPNESKTRKGKQSPIIKCCIPIQVPKRGRPRKEPAIIKPGTSKQDRDHAASNSTENRKPLVDTPEEVMVEKITDILIKYNFQNKKGKPDIAKLVKKVRNMVSKGYVTEEDMADDLTASIAKVLLPQHMSLPMVTNIMCESINNSAEPGATTSDADTELITSDPTPRYITDQNSDEPETRTKRKAAIAAEKSIDSLAQDVVISLDDDDFDARDTDFVPDDDDEAFKPKKKSKNLAPSKVLDTDESTMSADESRTTNHFDSLKTIIPTDDTDTSTRKPGPRKPKDRIIKTYSKKDSPSVPQVASKPIDKVPSPNPRVSAPPGIDYSSIILSDDEEAALSLKTKEKMVDSLKTTPAKPAPEPASEELVPLPISLLKNQNFINIVAHTYLVGNPMLDEDAATLAAQYSTLKAYKEAEQTGKDVCSGPIYDIAVKVIGKEILKKMNSANPKAAASSTNDAVASIQMKEQMIQTQKTFEETAKISKAKSAKLKLREDLIEQKLAMNKAAEAKAAEEKAKAAEAKAAEAKIKAAEAKAAEAKVAEAKIKAAEAKAIRGSRAAEVKASVVTLPAASSSSNVVPVGLVKMSGGPPLYREHIPAQAQRTEPRVECILPDDDDVIISDVRSAPPPSPPPAPVPLTKPIIVSSNSLYMPTTRGIDAQQNFRVTVGNNGAPAATPKLVTPPKFILKAYAPPPGPVPKLNLSAPPSAPAPAPPPERILPSNATICLDSDDEEALPPSVLPSLTAAPSALAPAPVPVALTSAPHAGMAAPVPISLTSAQNPGVNIPLPPMQNLLHHPAPANPTQQKLMLKVVNPNSAQPQYVLIPSDKIPLPTLNPVNEPPKPIHMVPQIVSLNSFTSPPVAPVLATPKPEISRTACKPGDILRISKTGTIEVITRADLQTNLTPSKPTSDPVETSDVVIQNPKPVDPKPPPVAKKTKIGVAKFRSIAAKTSSSNSLDLTNVTPEVSKPKTTVQKPVVKSATTVDLTHVLAAPKQKPITSKPTATATFDLTDTNEAAVPKKSTPQKIDTSRTDKKTDARKSRVISSSSSSSDSRAASPDNPLSILKDVVHIKAIDDYPDKSVTFKTSKSRTSNISVQHVISSDSKKKDTEDNKAQTLKLTRVPRDQVPKHIDAAVEKQIKKDALMKRITPLLSKNQPPKEEPKKTGKNTITFDNLSSATTSKLLKNTDAGKSMDKKVKPLLKADTVDLTNIFPPGTTIKSKSETKKRPSTSTEVTPVKKKKPAPMTLKDFNLDDIDDIIELD